MKKIINYLFLSTLLCVHTIYPLQRSLNYLKHTGSTAAQKIKQTLPDMCTAEIVPVAITSCIEGLWLSSILETQPTILTGVLIPGVYCILDPLMQFYINLYATYLIRNKKEVAHLLKKNMIDIRGTKIRKIIPPNIITKKSPATPLSMHHLNLACAHREVLLVELLLQAGAQVLEEDHTGRTASHYAVITQNDSEEIKEKKVAIQKLLEEYKAEYAQQFQKIIEAVATVPAEYRNARDVSGIITGYL